MGIIGNYTGVMVLQNGSSDAIGTPGDVTLSIKQEGTQPAGNIHSGTFFNATLTSVKQSGNGFLIEFPVRFAQKEYSAKAFCLLDGDWLWGVVKLGFEMMPGIDFVKLYLKRQSN